MEVGRLKMKIMELFKAHKVKQNLVLSTDQFLLLRSACP